MKLLHSEVPYIWGKFYFIFYQCMLLKFATINMTKSRKGVGENLDGFPVWVRFRIVSLFYKSLHCMVYVTTLSLLIRNHWVRNHWVRNPDESNESVTQMKASSPKPRWNHWVRNLVEAVESETQMKALSQKPRWKHWVRNPDESIESETQRKPLSPKPRWKHWVRNPDAHN